jgi:prevent-host-death family protein
MKKLAASEFKARCLAVLDEVEKTGEPVLILKRGRPVARLVPPVQEGGRYPQETLVGTVEIKGDILEPVVTAADWEAERAR